MSEDDETIAVEELRNRIRMAKEVLADLEDQASQFESDDDLRSQALWDNVAILASEVEDIELIVSGELETEE